MFNNFCLNYSNAGEGAEGVTVEEDCIVVGEGRRPENRHNKTNNGVPPHPPHSHPTPHYPDAVVAHPANQAQVVLADSDPTSGAMPGPR